MQTPDEADVLLADRRRYSFADEEAAGLDRVYYMNVDNPFVELEEGC